MGDTHTDLHGPQTITTGAATVLIGSQAAARLGDLVSCTATLIASQVTVLIGS